RPRRAPGAPSSPRAAASGSSSTSATRPTRSASRGWRADPPLPPGQAEHQLVDVAPAPVLARLDGADDGVLGGAVVGGRVAVGRVVAAPDVAALLAHPQMHPPAPRLQAFLAARDLRRRLQVLDRVEVRARGHGPTLRLARLHAVRARRRVGSTPAAKEGTMSTRARLLLCATLLALVVTTTSADSARSPRLA